MTLDELKKWFVEELKSRGSSDKYIDRTTERELQHFVVAQGISRDAFRAALAQVCESLDYEIESRVIAKLKDALEMLASKDGKIGQTQFQDAVRKCRKWTKGCRNEVQCIKLVMSVVEDAYKIERGWFGDWYAKMKRDIGM